MGDGDEDTSITIHEVVRDELRRYKADDGLTYNQAIARLLDHADWIEDESDLINKIKKSDSK